MRAFCLLVEALESRPEDADRVAALARWLRCAGRAAAAVAAEWLVAGAPRSPRPARLPMDALLDAAATLAARAGTPPWLFDAGRAASGDAAEVVALLLPWPDQDAPAPALADWLAAWREAARAAGPDGRALAVAGTIAALPDAAARRWAARAAGGLARPLASAWQWQRARAEAFGEDLHALAWAWHRGAHGEVPRPGSLAPLDEAPEAWHPAPGDGDWAEPRWRGLRVQVIARAGAVAIWQRGGPLLNALLAPALVEPARWPATAAFEGVLVARRDGRVVAVAEALAARPRAAAHVVLTDWSDWAGAQAGDTPAPARRARLVERWPAPALGADGLAGDPPPVFASPALATDPGSPDELRAAADAARAAGFAGLVLRRGTGRWSIRASARRVRAVLLYVPTDALGANPDGLAQAACGFALWSRLPASDPERDAAMTAAQAGEPPSADRAALHLLPLARLVPGLPNDALQRLHAWLRAHAGRRFGGVHAVAPAQVFEIAYARARPSRRHRLGAVLEDARVVRWIEDAAPGAADTAGDIALE